MANWLRRVAGFLRWLVAPFDEPTWFDLNDRRWEREQTWLAYGTWVGETSSGGRPPTRGEVRARAAEVARRTFGDAAWEELRRRGYLDVRSHRIAGLTYRLRVGRRVQLIWDTPRAARGSPWAYLRYLCINPAYPMPAAEFAAQLYLYLRDAEDEIVRVAIPQPFDQLIDRVF